MSHQEHFDVLIIGSGEAGKNLAWSMADAGRRTAVLEELIGGSCPNIACLPSKNIIYSAKVAQLACRGAEFGAMMPSIKIEMPTVRARKRKMVDGEIRLHLELYKASGAELIMGEAQFTGPKTVKMKSDDGAVHKFSGDQVVLNLGTHAAIPDIPGLRAARPLTHIEALELDRIPEHLVFLGGGYVGLELSQAMRRFGSRVTILERGRQLIGREDPDVAQAILQLLQDDGIDVLFDAEVVEVQGSSRQSTMVRLHTSEGERTLEHSDLLVAVRRVPNTQGIGLEKTGAEVDGHGYMRVNERLQTSAPGVWAIGECAGSPHFTHVATDDFRIVRDNLNGGKRTTQGRLVPFCTFTDPELARVGLSELEAQKRAIPYRVATIPMTKVRRSAATSETRGFLKTLISADHGRFLIIAVLLACIPSALWGHGVVGKRMFIEPLFTEDANIKNELDLPRAEFLMLPDGSYRSFSASFEKALYPNRWSVVIAQSRVYRRVAGSTIAGFDDLEVGTKLTLYRSPEHELVLTPALFLTAPTGSHSVAEHRTKLQPALVFAKGFGDLKWGLLRPLALQGDIGYETALTGGRERYATYDMVLEYSVPYLNRFIRNADTRFDLEHNLRLGHCSGAILGDMYPFIEFNGSTPIAGTAGSSATFLRPGLAYVGKFFQISTAADVPFRGYLPRRRVGAVVLFDLFLNEVLPGFGWTPFGKRPHHDDER